VGDLSEVDGVSCCYCFPDGLRRSYLLVNGDCGLAQSEAREIGAMARAKPRVKFSAKRSSAGNNQARAGSKRSNLSGGKKNTIRMKTPK
jgi:hypothetical protein